MNIQAGARAPAALSDLWKKIKKNKKLILSLPPRTIVKTSDGGMAIKIITTQNNKTKM